MIIIKDDYVLVQKLSMKLKLILEFEFSAVHGFNYLPLDASAFLLLKVSKINSTNISIRHDM